MRRQLKGCIRERDLVQQAVFGALSSDPPHALVEVEFAPAHRGDFLAALPGENEQADDRAVVTSSRACPNEAQFLVAEYTIARDFLRRFVRANNRIGVGQPLGDRPRDERRKIRTASVRRYRTALFGNPPKLARNIGTHNFHHGDGVQRLPVLTQRARHFYQGLWLEALCRAFLEVSFHDGAEGYGGLRARLGLLELRIVAEVHL